MKAWAKAGLAHLGLLDLAGRARIRVEPGLVRVVRFVTRRDPRLLARYLASHAVRKLHIGCGDNELAGWLNTELCPRGRQIYLDATRRFPFPDETFAFVYAEHMIEHITAEAAEAMLGECARVMVPGGVIRIVTPDLGVLVGLLDAPLPPDLAAYVRYSVEAHRIPAREPEGVHVFNHFVRGWGHRFIHTPSSLEGLMRRAGFVDIQSRPLNDSPHAELAGLARVDRMPPGFLQMESFVLEGSRPHPPR